MTEQQTERMQMRLSPSFLKAVDGWRRKQADLPSRTEAIRRLVGIGLAKAPKPKSRRARSMKVEKLNASNDV